MSLTKTVEIDKIEIVNKYCVQVRQKTTILENDNEISSTFSRWVITPGSDYSNEEHRVQSICKVLHTENAIREYKESLNKPSLDD